MGTATGVCNDNNGIYGGPTRRDGAVLRQCVLLNPPAGVVCDICARSCTNLCTNLCRLQNRHGTLQQNAFRMITVSYHQGEEFTSGDCYKLCETTKNFGWQGGEQGFDQNS